MTIVSQKYVHEVKARRNDSKIQNSTCGIEQTSGFYVPSCTFKGQGTVLPIHIPVFGIFSNHGWTMKFRTRVQAVYCLVSKLVHLMYLGKRELYYVSNRRVLE